jgi:hypothetical protein
MKYVVTVLVVLCMPWVGRTQGTEVWQQYRDKYPEEPAVYLNRSETINILLKGDSLQVIAAQYDEVLHLKDNSDVFVSQRVHGSGFSEVSNLKASTFVWDKGKYKEVKVSNFLKNADSGDGIFYDDSYYYTFSFPSIAPNNRTVTEYTVTYKEPKFMPGYFFASHIPTVKSTFTIKAQKDVELIFKVLNDEKKQIAFREYEKGGFRFYEWSLQDMKAMKVEDDSPNIRYYAPHVVAYVKSYKNSKGTQTVLGDVNDLYRWYYSLVANVNKEPSEELKTVVADLKSKSTSELDLVKNVYYWVQNNVRYIAFEDGMRGFIPHSGSYVCEKRYGDCKDMANLIVSMLQVAGVKAYHTWIGTRDIPYRYSEIPTPLVDNHMIAAYIAPDGRYYFLDATGSETPFGLPSSMIQGKEALISFGPDKFEVRKVEEIAKEVNIMVDSVTISIDNSQLTGSGRISLSGYPKAFAGYQLNRSQEESVSKYVARLASKGSNKFFLDKYALNNLANKDESTVIDYNFRIGDYFQKIGNELYVNLNLNKDYYNAYIPADSRQSPKENEYRYVKEEVCVFQIPEGYEVEYLPENRSHSNTFLGLDVTYEALPGKILFKKKFYMDFLMIGGADFKTWNESVKVLSEVYKESIILKKK